MAATLTLLTAEEFLADPQYEGWELLDGVPKECRMGVKSCETAGEVYFVIRGFLASTGLGRVFPPDLRIRIWPERPNHVRRADVSFVSRSRAQGLADGDLTIAPDLVVEVVSTHEGAAEAEAKRLDYMSAGVKLMWVIYPRTRTVHVFRPGGLAAIISSGDSLSGEDVLPGFSVPVERLFPR